MFLGAQRRLITGSKFRLVFEGTAWDSGKDTSRIGRVCEVPNACDMATPSCTLPEQAGANATGKDPRTDFQC